MPITATWSNSRPLGAVRGGQDELSVVPAERGSFCARRRWRRASQRRCDRAAPRPPGCARAGWGGHPYAPARSAGRLVRGERHEKRVEAVVVEQQAVFRRAVRNAALQGDGRVRGELGVGPRQDRVDARRGRQPSRQQSSGAVQVVAGSGASARLPSAAGRAPDRLGETLLVAADEAHSTLDDRPRTAVVRHEVDPPQSGERAGEIEHTPHVGQPPRVDRLVVVADEEDVAPLPDRGARPARAAIGRRPAPRPRGASRIGPASAASAAASSRSSASARRTRSSKSSASRPPANVRRRRNGSSRSRLRSAGALSGARREQSSGAASTSSPSSSLRRENPSSSRRISAGRQGPSAVQSPQRLGSVGQVLNRSARLRQDLAAKGMEGPHAHLRVRRKRLQRAGQARPQLFGRALVEGHCRDRGRVRTGCDQPAHPGDQRRRLAAPSGGNAQHRAWWSGRGRTLVRRQSVESVLDGGVERLRHAHRADDDRADHQPLTSWLVGRRHVGWLCPIGEGIDRMDLALPQPRSVVPRPR